MEIIQNDVNVDNLSYIQKASLAYNEPKQPGDIDYVSILYVILRDKLGAKAASNFIETPFIFDVLNKRPLQQRVMINKYFILKLLTWRSLSISGPIWGVIPYLDLQSDFASWLNGIYGAIIPFLSSNCIE